ncbi:MAG: MFS transporter [Bacteroidales bacterium]|nr:MFS transporter [Bacteroidales bacterium]MCF8391154.1 MFS transporter [Bacteroidales bacterium]
MVKNKQSKNTSPWFWVPSLYFAEGIPYVLVMTLSVIFYKRMGISNTDIALYTSWLYLPWVIKPLWSPVVDILRTKRYWIVFMELLVGAGLAGVAFTIPVHHFFQYTLAFFWLLAFSSATHDIAADGFYMLGLTKHEQAFFVGIRSTFYRMAMLTGQGLLVILAGYFEAKTGLPPVEVSVRAEYNIDSDFRNFQPTQIESYTDDDSLYIISKKDVSIDLKRIDKTERDQFIQVLEDWNISHGFYTMENSGADENKKISWWAENISAPLTSMLKNIFDTGDEDTGQLLCGNIAYTYFMLSNSPREGETVVLNFSHDSGDKSISLIKSYRFEFNDKNWNQPAFAVFQLDPKLEKPNRAMFLGLSGDIRFSWMIVFGIIALVFVLFSLYHKIVLPRPLADVSHLSGSEGFLKEFLNTFAEFFRKKELGVMLIFLLVYRLGESQLVKLASPFLLDSREMNGLGLTTGEIGLIYGTIGILFLTLGGIIGGILASRNGLKYWLWWMVIAMNLPNLVYVFLSYALPDSLWIIGASVAVEQFGYGFGFTAYMLYMIYISDGKHKTAHFAITTGFMALGMMIPGMISGWLQDIIGYQNFFIWVMICTIPAFLIVPFLKIDPGFGRKTTEK